ncbi:MAG: hypothetical protein Q7T51_04290 [Candidatus Moranbacteria bacterium]|nr:hypothetical protein [Candidatus Moranbacteria bacterium]
MSKKSVLWISGIAGGAFVFLLLALLYNFCGAYRGICKETFGFIVYPFSPLPFVFLLSLITYKMRDEVFQAWWRFARWFVPVIMLVTFLINSQGRSGGMGISGAISSSFNMLIIGIFYAVFIVTSLVKIMSVYKSKK